MANVINAGADTGGDDKHFLHSGFSATIDDSYFSPDTAPRGITWDGTNVISADTSADKHYLHSGFSSTIDDSYTSPDSSPRGISWDGTNVLSADVNSGGKHFLHSGFSSTIDDSYASPATAPVGISWDGTNVLSADSGTDKHYLHSGFSSTIDDSYTSPSTVPRGISWDGTNVISSDASSDKHYLHSGFSSTIDDSYAAPFDLTRGITWDGRFAATSAVTGTITPSSTEAQIVSGGRTIIITLTDDTWVAAGGTFDGIRQDIIDGLDSAQSELTGWNAEVRDKQLVAGVVRTSDTIVTITLTAQPGYNITDAETITVTVPASALALSVSPVVSTPTFAVTEIPVATVSGTAVPSSTEAQIVAGGRTVIITLADDEWVASGATFNAVRQAIIDGLDSAQSELTGWNAEVRDKEVVTAVVRTNDTVVTITLTAQAAYDITSNETITVTVPASALDQTALPITATPTFSVVPIPGPTDVDPFESIAGNGLGGIGRNHVPPGVIVNY